MGAGALMRIKRGDAKRAGARFAGSVRALRPPRSALVRAGAPEPFAAVLECLLREDPVRQVLDLVLLLGLDDRVLLLVAVFELHLRTRRDVLNDAIAPVGFALVFGCDVLEGGALLLLVDRMAFEAVALPRKLLRRCRIDGARKVETPSTRPIAATRRG
jgi:hypothetical protein